MAGLMQNIRRRDRARRQIEAETRGEAVRPARRPAAQQAAPSNQANKRRRKATPAQGLRRLPITRAQPVRSISGADERSRQMQEIQRRIRELEGGG